MKTIETTADIAKHEVIELLFNYGITPTQQRIEIACILFSHPQHVSAVQMIAQLNSNQQKASKATIYNTLGLFAKRGLIREIIVDPTKVFYNSKTTDHHHFYNMDTRVLTDIDDEQLLSPHLPKPPEGTELERIDVIYRIRNTKAIQ